MNSYLASTSATLAVILLGNVSAQYLPQVNRANTGLMSHYTESFSVEPNRFSGDRSISYKPPKDIGRPRRTWPSGGRAA